MAGRRKAESSMGMLVMVWLVVGRSISRKRKNLPLDSEVSR